jgi:hypothetical protein
VYACTHLSEQILNIWRYSLKVDEGTFLEINEIRKRIRIAEQAVEGLTEPLKTKAFGVILSKLLEEISSIGKPPIGEPFFAGKPEEPPRISGATTCREAIFKLMSSDWGKKPRTMREISDALKMSAIYYQDPVVSTELRRMTRIGMLRRLKSEDGNFAYVIARPM